MSKITEAWQGLSPNGKRGVVGGGIGVLAVALIATLVLAGGGDEEAAPSTTTSSTTTTAAVTTTTEPDTGPVAPLTGLRVEDPALIARPALAVKIDNLDAPSESAVPQTGLTNADVVFEEIVEGNITRLVGIFHSKPVGQVGPVRSARTTDLQILPQLGRPLLAWSGGNEGVTAAVHANPSIVDVGYDRATSAYHRDSSRRAPHNLYVDADALWGFAPEGLPAPTAMFGYRTAGEANNATATRAQGVDINWGGGVSAPVSWRWDPNLRLYLRSQRGRPHMDAGNDTQLSATNVVVLVTEYGQSPADARSPEAHPVGSGEAFIYTNGTVVHGKWVRPDVNKAALLVDDEDHIVKLTPGQTWVELPRAGNATNVP